jgi:hypothetical protein
MVFSLPTLPSLPSLRNILDPEPQVLYPPSATNTPLPSPSAKARIKTLPPVPVPNWPKEERGRRTSVSSTSSRHGFAPSLTFNSSSGGLNLNVGGGSTRPGHRRAHSAVPLRGAPVQVPVSVQVPVHAAHVPQGRLTEFSLGRNSLASTSALSLPTLVEAEADTYIEPSNQNQNHRRRGSRSSIHSNSSAMSSLPPSPRRPHASLPNPTSVPPPVPRTNSKRPVLSPRAWSVMDVRPIHEEEHQSTSTGEGRKGLTRHESFTRPSSTTTTTTTAARPKLAAVSERRMSSSQVSDVAVLASWHFPDEPSGGGSGEIGGGLGGVRPGLVRGHSAMPSAGSSRDLADRLRSLAAIDTSPSTISSTPSTSTTPTTTLIARGFQPKLSHRYTASSPNLNIYSTPGHGHGHGHGNGNGHRRGLRQPTPLGSNSNNLSSSPGSLSLSISTSDTDSTEPISPVGSLASQAGGGGGGRWFDKARQWGRRGSSVSLAPVSVGDGNGKGDEVREVRGLELYKREEEEDEEVYIDFDKI